MDNIYNNKARQNEIKCVLNLPIFMEIKGDIREERAVICQDIIHENIIYYLEKKKKNDKLQYNTTKTGCYFIFLFH